jgi:hypothetical protein
VEDILSTTEDSVSARPSTTTDPHAALGAADRAGEPRSSGCQLGTVDLAAGGAVAVTRPSMPRFFRLLLALTGVRV